jgi:hypothetical protein
MPAYTILIMRRNETDRRPLTLHISAGLFWSLIFLAVALPVGGFLVSAGVIAPAWLKLDFTSMQQQVKQAERIQKENKALKDQFSQLQTQLDNERRLRGEAETKATMAETAQKEATTRLTEQEGDMVTLKKSVASYEQLLKPKLDRELLQCVGLEADATASGVTYSLSFAKLTKTADLPAGLTARVRVVTGDNAVDMEHNATSTKMVTTPINAKDLHLKGQLAVAVAPDTTRLIDVKVFDSAGKPVGYCWKTF